MNIKNIVKPCSQNPFFICLSLSFILVVSIICLQRMGFLNGLELRAYDQLLPKSSQDKIDDRLVIISETEPDIRRYGHPLSDQILTDALQLVEEAGANVIGVDKYRDIPVPPGSGVLKNILEKNSNIIWIFFAGNSREELISAPASLVNNPERIGFCNIVKDLDGVVRRGLLFLDVEENRYYSFPLLVALKYFVAENKTVAMDEQGNLILNGVSIPKITPNYGVYNNLEVDGYQIMLDYPGMPNTFRTFTLSDLLDGKIPQNALRDKIVLFGAIAPSLQDYWLFPKEITRFGIEYHAYFISQLLNIADTPPLLTKSDNVEHFWLFLWCLIGAVTGFCKKSVLRFSALIILQAAILIGSDILLLNQGWFLPTVAPLFGWIAGLFFSVLIGLTNLRKHLAQSHEILEQHVEKTTELQQANVAMEDANQKLIRLASTDALTQIANRRSFDDKLATEWLRHHREQQPLAVILGDVDFFKRFNDHYGHPAGDECLRRVASCFKQVITRNGDLAARYGGEEFVVILPNTDIQAASVVAEKLLNTMREMKLPHEFSDASEFVSISLGVSSLIPTSTTSSGILLQNADKALYVAKEKGRNCYCIG